MRVVNITSFHYGLTVDRLTRTCDFYVHNKKKDFVTYIPMLSPLYQVGMLNFPLFIDILVRSNI